VTTIAAVTAEAPQCGAGEHWIIIRFYLDIENALFCFRPLRLLTRHRLVATRTARADVAKFVSVTPTEISIVSSRAPAAGSPFSTTHACGAREVEPNLSNLMALLPVRRLF
jgi:hypothetical protein